MVVRFTLHRAAIEAERLWDRMKPDADLPPLLEPYCGFAGPDRLILRGRVLTSLRRTEPDPRHSKFTNLRQMASLFFTTEVAKVPVRLPGTSIRAISDEEGYLQFEVPRDGRGPGWAEFPVAIEGDPTTIRAFPALIPREDARYGVISDIDDTMIETGAYSLARNLWTTFTGSTLTRTVFADAVDLMARLSDGGRNPVFYVSSSPWNLHHFLETIFARAGLVRGPVFLRDLGVSEKKLVTNKHGAHKSRAIDRILAANPALPFVLIGDTGQHDAKIYREAAARHPDRIAGVVLREPGRGADADDMAEIRALGDRGVRVHHGADFTGVPRGFPDV